MLDITSHSSIPIWESRFLTIRANVPYFQFVPSVSFFRCIKPPHNRCVVYLLQLSWKFFPFFLQCVIATVI